MQSLVKGLILHRATPSQILIFAFLGVILLGALLLSTPWAGMDGKSIRWVDALFTATSAVCVTGLIVLDTPSDFSLFGQMIILLLIQLGGLGYAASATLLVLLMGGRITIRGRLVMKEALNVMGTEGIVRLAKWILMVTLVVELMGAAFLSWRFWGDYEPMQAIYFGVFHSISAFNNAGFSLFSDSLGGYQNDWVVSLTVALLIVSGGIGFIVYRELYQYNVAKQIYRVSVHSKLVLLVTGVTILGATFFIFLFEYSHGAMANLSIGGKLVASFFQAVSARTAGFSTLNISAMFNFTLFLMILLMLMGGSPGSTAGGLKTTTVGVMLASLWTTIRGRRDVSIMNRRIPSVIVSRAFMLTYMAMLLLAGFTLLLLYVEGREFFPTLFEVVSGLATVGLSMGDGGSRSFTALFSDFGKLCMVVVMFIGRLGPLTIGIGAFGATRKERVRYPEEKILIG